MRPHITMIISLIFAFNLLATPTYGSTSLGKKINVAGGRILGVSELKHAALNFLNQRMGFEEVVRQEASCLTQGHAHCLGNGRKLLMKSPIVSNKNKIKREEASPTKRENTKPDVLDIAGMDYSPAKRKPPIHN